MEENATRRAAQRINATNPGQLNVQNVTGGVNVGNFQEGSDGDFMQLMYEQATELDAVDRISQERQNWKRQS